MSAQHNLFAAANPQQGSSALSKRKRGSWCVEDFTYEQNKVSWYDHVIFIL